LSAIFIDTLRYFAIVFAVSCDRCQLISDADYFAIATLADAISATPFSCDADIISITPQADYAIDTFRQTQRVEAAP
jgi:hypothetical protein